MSAKLLRNPLDFEFSHLRPALSCNLHNIRRIPSIPVSQTLPTFKIPLGCFLTPTLGTCSRARGSVYSRSNQKRFDLVMLQAVLNGGSGGDGGFKGSGDGGYGGGGGEETGGNGWSFLSWPANAIVKTNDRVIIEGHTGGKGRPKLTLEVVVRKDTMVLNITEHDALDIAHWKGWVHVADPN